VRYRLMATYRGSPFEAGIGPADGDIVLFAACPPPEDLGFEPATGHWRKQLRLSEVQAVWESRPVGTFRGERCMVLDDLGDRLHIGYLGHDGYQAEHLGYWQVDRGVFELVASRSEVSDIIEERTEYPRPHGAASASPEPAAQPADLLPPGSTQDQARYLPPDSTASQASYLLDWPGYFQSPPEPAPAYPAAAPQQATYGWPEPGTPGRYPADPDTGQHPAVNSRPVTQSGPGYLSSPGAGIALPPAVEPPLPLEAAALRAASASRPRPSAAQRRSAATPAEPAASVPPGADLPPASMPAVPLPPASMPAVPLASPSADRPGTPLAAASAPVTRAEARAMRSAGASMMSPAGPANMPPADPADMAPAEASMMSRPDTATVTPAGGPSLPPGDSGTVTAASLAAGSAKAATAPPANARAMMPASPATVTADPATMTLASPATVTADPATMTPASPATMTADPAIAAAAGPATMTPANPATMTPANPATVTADPATMTPASPATMTADPAIAAAAGPATMTSASAATTRRPADVRPAGSDARALDRPARQGRDAQAVATAVSPAGPVPAAHPIPARNATATAAPQPPSTGHLPPAGRADSAAGPQLQQAHPDPAPPSGPRRSARRRLATERLFAELASLAGIPVDSYAIGEEVEGALCLLQAEQGFEVFHSAEGNRHELQFFGSEEAACFYLFGVLAAEAVRKGSLLPAAGRPPAGPVR
jgi:hypothetical protein